jgi:hypothetical protein
MLEGNIVVNMDDFTTKKLPDLENLTKQEIKLLQYAFKTKKFKKEDIIKNRGSDAENLLINLIKKNFLVEDNDTVTLSNEYIFSQLSKNACFEKIKYLEINYNRKFNSKVSIDKIKEKISKYCNIKDQRECFIVNYKVNY